MHCNRSILSFILTTVYQLSSRTEHAGVLCGTVCCFFIHRTEFRSNQGEFLLKCFEGSQLEIMNTCFIMLSQSLEIIKSLQCAAFNLMMSVNLIKISKQFLC